MKKYFELARKASTIHYDSKKLNTNTCRWEIICTGKINWRSNYLSWKQVFTSGIRTITIHRMRLVISLLLTCPPNPTAHRLKVRIQNWINFFASLLLLHYILYELLCFNQRQLKYLYSYLPPVFITVTPTFFFLIFLFAETISWTWLESLLNSLLRALVRYNYFSGHSIYLSIYTR